MKYKWKMGNCAIARFLLLAMMESFIVASTPYVTSGLELRLKRSYESHNKHPVTNENSVEKSVRAGPVFATENSTVVLAQKGGTARLPCIVRKFNNGVVSWIRKDTLPPKILTIGLGTHTTDDRILVEHARHLQNWGLIIKHVQPQDAGLYECQVSTHPATSIFIELRVTEAFADIMGAPDLHIRAGSPLRLVCRILHSTEPPVYVFWYHDQKMINHETGVSVTMDKDSSVLHLSDAETTHIGNYTCQPSNAIMASINVHVLNATEEENPAAMLHANANQKFVELAVKLNLFIILIMFHLY